MLFFSTAEKLDICPAMPQNAPLSALILDPSSFDRRRIKREFGNSGYSAQIDEISCLCHLKASLREKPYDIVVCDYFLPDGSGEDAMKILLSDELNKAASPVVVSANPWLKGGSISVMGKTISLVDKSSLGSGDLIKEIALSRQVAFH